MNSIEVAKSAKTLICFLQSMTGNEVVVELRNDHFVKGRLISVDSFMNLEFNKAKQWSIYANLDPNAEDGSEYLLTPELPKDKTQITEHSYILIKGERIRFVHVDRRVNMLDNMREQIDIYQNMKVKANAPRINWKIHRKRMKLEQLQYKLSEAQPSSSQAPSSSSSSTFTTNNQAQPSKIPTIGDEHEKRQRRNNQ